MSLMKNATSLFGKQVDLIPLEIHHSEDLFRIAKGENIWRWFPEHISSFEVMAKCVKTALTLQKLGQQQPFTMIEKRTGQICGSTRFMNIESPHRKLEIGSTFIGLDWQRTFVNTEVKYLLMKHAFETLKCVRVEFKTDERNLKSRAAILRIGAKQEGILRNHMVTYDGSLRNTVYFSVIENEWSGVKAKLECLVYSLLI